MQKPLPTPDKKNVVVTNWWLWLANLPLNNPRRLEALKGPKS
jgi:hypothetical protein